MAIDYFLVFERRPDAADVQRFLLGQGLRSADGKLLLDEHLSAFVHADADRPFSVSFRLDKWGDYEVCMARMYALVAAMLQRFPGDAELSFENETALLARQAGAVARGESDDVWTSAGWDAAVRIFDAHRITLGGLPPKPETGE